MSILIISRQSYGVLEIGEQKYSVEIECVYVYAWRKSGENAESNEEREREKERGRIRINCTVPPNCPERINTGVHEARADLP